MPVNEFAGKPAPQSLLENIPRLVSQYYTLSPDPGQSDQRVSFGTSGHRGTAKQRSFNEDHILAVSQALCEYRRTQKIDGPLILGMDTHALSEPAHVTALEVFAANGVDVRIHKGLEFTPTPVVSHAILACNRGRKEHLADGVVITPSHNPPADGGFKYNPPEGGPAGAETTKWIQDRANQILEFGLKDVHRTPYAKAVASGRVTEHDFMTPYLEDLANIVDMAAIRDSGLKIGVDPLGGSGVHFWAPLRERYGVDLTVVNDRVDPSFSFMTVDKDGKIRMDCSSPYAMASLIRHKDSFDVAFGNDPDYDRHGVVTRDGLMNPNHYLAVAVDYLFQHRPGWKNDAAVGKTLVSSSMIDRVAAKLGRKLREVPVGFKWFVDGLLSGSLGFGGEESAGASFLRFDGTVWTTDKDGIIMDLLACEITAKTGQSPSERYAALADEFGAPVYERLDAPASPDQKEILSRLTPDMVEGSELAGEPITAKLTRAPGNDAAIGGLKVASENGWFAARPSGTEHIYKIYSESFKGEEHLRRIQEQAQEMVQAAFKTAGVVS